MDDGDRQRDIDRVGEAHAALIDHLAAMTGRPGASPSVPSLLPGWTRGHVLTHIARNADSFVRVLEAARQGEVVTQYEGGVAGRNAAIEAGATRDWIPSSPTSNRRRRGWTRCSPLRTVGTWR